VFFLNLQINVFNIYGSGPSPAAGTGRGVAPGPDEDGDFCRFLYRKIQLMPDDDNEMVIEMPQEMARTFRRLCHGQPAVHAVPDQLRGCNGQQRQQQ